MKAKSSLVLVIALLFALTVSGLTAAQDEITSVCLVTDIGRVNDGSFNQSANDGMMRAAADFNLDTTYIETQAQTDYEANLQTCIDNGYDIVVVVGFLIYDATIAAAKANPDVYFIGIDQVPTEAVPNYVGVQYREDQAGFLAGAMAALMTETGKVGGVYGLDIPPVIKFRNGFEQGARFINSSIELFGVYIPDFQAPQEGAEAAEAFIAEGVDVVFGAGGPTGSGGIVRAAELGAWVIGVDQDEYFTTFGEGETPGADRIITSAMKRVDNSVYDMIELLVDSSPLPSDSIYVMDASIDGVGFAPPHDAPVPDTVVATVQEIFDLLAVGDLTTGVDPVTGELVSDSSPAPTATAGGTSMIGSVCLVTDVGRVNDGSFNQSAYQGLLRVADEFSLDVHLIETIETSQYEANIGDCIEGGYDAIVTVGFLITDVTAAAAALHPDVYFIGVDQFHSSSLPNLVGIQFREDQAGFLAGVLAAQLSETGTIAGIYGVEIPPVRKFRAGFEQGAKYIDPEIEVLGEFIPDFVAPQLGAEAAERFIEAGADVIFGAGGITGSAGIRRAAELGAYVIGVDQDEYVTTFENGAAPASNRIVSSAIKGVEQGVFDMVELLVQGEPFPAGSLYLMDASMNGVGFAPANEADIPEEVVARTQEVFDLLASGKLTTGVDPITGDLMGGQ
jgi:basic membrane protein A and related proteins